jgi:autoinducer-2 kinase
MGHLLAIDAGTGGCRAVVFSDEGRPLAGARRRWALTADPDHPGSVDFDTRAAWALISECVRESLAEVRAGDVSAVSAVSVRGGLVLFDAAGDELWACGSTDARAADQVRSVRQRDPGFEAEAYRSSGQTLAMAALPRLLLDAHWPGAKQLFFRLASKIALAFLAEFPSPQATAHIHE